LNLEPTDEQRALRDTMRRFLSDHASTSREVWRGLADLGATGVLIPLEYGGLGLSMVDACVIAEEVGAALLSEPWSSTAVLAPRAISRFGVTPAGANVLTSIAEGTLRVAVGPSDVTSAAVTPTGPELLNGELAAVVDAHAADAVLVIARRDQHTALFCVETASSGVVIDQLKGIDKFRRESRVVLRNAPARLLGTTTDGIVDALVDDLLVISAADALGTAQRLLDMVVAYAKTRVQFGHPIGSFQSVGHLCVDMFETIELTRSGVLHAAWAIDEADRDVAHLAALRIKAFAGRLASVGDTAIQVLGGIGFTWEHDAHRHLRRLLSWSALLGGPDPYLEEVGARFVGSLVDSERPGRQA
jgi:alkylation response protein AidB-like acyl-CoA dehydrogenase